MMYFLLLCPKCGNKQKYHTTTKIISDKRKKCVYCNASFKIKDTIITQTTRV